MIAVLLLSLAAPQAAEADEIIVLGRRLAETSVIVGRDARGRFTCGLNGTTGNVALDSRLCRTAAKCVKDGARDAAVTACIDRRKPALLAEVRRTMAHAR